MTQDLTLDEIRSLLAPGIAANAAFDGWSDAARDMAADAAGIDRDVAALAFEQGPVDMIDAWFADIDVAMLASLPPERAAALTATFGELRQLLNEADPQAWNGQ